MYRRGASKKATIERGSDESDDAEVVGGAWRSDAELEELLARLVHKLSVVRVRRVTFLQARHDGSGEKAQVHHVPALDPAELLREL